MIGSHESSDELREGELPAPFVITEPGDILSAFVENSILTGDGQLEAAIEPLGQFEELGYRENDIDRSDLLLAAYGKEFDHPGPGLGDLGIGGDRDR